MLSELQTRKLTHLFNLYDVDKDGHVDKADYVQVVENLARLRNYTVGTPAYDSLLALYMSIWARLQQSTDANRDQRVTLNEFLTRYDVLLRQQEVAESVVIMMADMVTQMTDTDGDGRIAKAEFVAFLVAHNVDEEDAQSAFQYLDRTGDSLVTRDELLMNVQDFLCSDMPDAPGNWLFGPF